MNQKSDSLADAVLQRPHPLRRTFRIVLGMGAIVLLLAGSSALTVFDQLQHVGTVDFGTVFAPLFLAASGLAVMLYARHLLALLPALQLLNAALNQITRGRYDVAETLLRRAEVRRTLWFGERPSAPAVQRHVALHRATIALGRGDLARAAAEADRALSIRPGFRDRASQRMTTLRALGIRAFARALSDDATGARDDIARLRAQSQTKHLGVAVVSGEAVLTDPLARAAIAEAILLARANENEALRQLFARSRATMFEYALPRERTLLRGLERKLEATTSSPYRKAPKADTVSGDEPGVEDWIARVLPDVASFIPKSQRGEPGAQSADAAELRSTRAAPPLAPAKRSARRQRRLIALVGFIGLFAILFEMMNGTTNATGASEPASNSLLKTSLVEWLPGLSLIGMSAVVAWIMMRRRRAYGVLESGYLALAEGRLDEAKATLASLPNATHGLFRGLAALSLARLATRRGHFDEALSEAERGLGAIIDERAKASASDVLLPELETERAVALAVTGRADDALAIASTLPEGFAYRARSLFRIGLFALVRDDRIDEAAKLVTTEATLLPLDPRTALVADLVRALGSPEGLGLAEKKRLHEEARRPENRAFLESAAPRLLTALERQEDHEERVTEELEDAEAEREIDAADEARFKRPSSQGAS